MSNLISFVWADIFLGFRYDFGNVDKMFDLLKKIAKLHILVDLMFYLVCRVAIVSPSCGHPVMFVWHSSLHRVKSDIISKRWL